MLPTIKELRTFQGELHQQNVNAGWWVRPRSHGTLMALIHSELSEALEGDRKNLMDDHLPCYKAFWVELADAAIRALDYLAYREYLFSRPYKVPLEGFKDMSKPDFLYEMHKDLALTEHYMSIEISLEDCVADLLEYAASHDVDLFKIMREKVEYNRARKDHTKEAREGSHGKSY